MRTLTFIFLFGVLGLFMSSFIHKEKNDTELTSPFGFQIANSYNELLNKLNDSEIQKILDIKFIENDKFNAAFIDVELKDGSKSRRIIGAGEIISENDILENSNILGTITYSCSGCANCLVGGTIDGDGVLTITCSNTCCTLYINQPPISG